MKTILGTGQLGLTVMETLLQNNPYEKILLVNREGRLARPIPQNVKIVAADVTNRNDMTAIAQKSELIFSCTDVPYPIWSAFYPATASALAHALSKTNASLVFADNLYSYGNLMGATIDEKMPHNASTKKGRIRANALNTLLHSDQEFSEGVAIVKASDFIGPKIHKGVFGIDFLQKLYSNKAIILAGKLALPHTFTYIKDFATAMINVGTATDTFGQTWHVPNAPALSLTDWVRLFEAESHKKAKLIALPKSIVWLTGLFNPIVKEYYELAYQYEYPYLVSHDKYVARFGNHATTPLTIVKETIQWYQSIEK
ncbi:MAG: NAD-dependent epimerase/dehydratase family protein [Saprospiraceae bacterium]|nr:NAD-dependent epimerase/dehydratase family protein [Saprospiraceae bacterium]